MALVARIIVVSVVTGGLGAGLGPVLFWNTRDSTGISLLLGCLGAIVGAIAGTAREIVTALKQKPSIW